MLGGFGRSSVVLVFRKRIVYSYKSIKNERENEKEYKLSCTNEKIGSDVSDPKVIGFNASDLNSFSFSLHFASATQKVAQKTLYKFMSFIQEKKKMRNQ